MINLGRIKIPPLKNVLDVAMQTVRQQVPEKPGPSPRPPQNVRFANMGKILKEHFFFYFSTSIFLLHKLMKSILVFCLSRRIFEGTKKRCFLLQLV